MKKGKPRVYQILINDEDSIFRDEPDDTRQRKKTWRKGEYYGINTVEDNLIDLIDYKNKLGDVFGRDDE